MGLQINKELNQQGLTIPAGSVISWSTTFLVGTKNIQFSPVYLFLSIADRDSFFSDPLSGIKPHLTSSIEHLQGFYTYQMSDAQYLALNTETGVMDTVQDYLKSEIVENSDGYLTDSDISIVPSYL